MTKSIFDKKPKTYSMNTILKAKALLPLLTCKVVEKMGEEDPYKRSITYTEAAELLNRSTTLSNTTARSINRPLGYIRDMCVENGLPRINVIVVSKKTGIAGERVLGKNIVNLSERKEAWEAEMQKVGEFKDLDKYSEI